jgi:hypothetical protein
MFSITFFYSLCILIIVVLILIFLTANVLIRQTLLSPEELNDFQLKELESRKGKLFSIPMCDSYILCYTNITNSDKIIIYCHGNCGNIYKRKTLLDLLEKEQLSFCIFDYRGYGPTTNSFRPTIESMIEDAKRVIQFFSEKGFRIILWGESLGALIISKILKEKTKLNDYKIQKIILFSPFIGIKETLKSNGLSLLCIFFPHLRNLSIEKIDVPFPVLVIYSEDDNLSSRDLIKKVFINSENLCQIIIKGTHSKPRICFNDLLKIKKFIS